jgi:hypothetical protein
MLQKFLRWLRQESWPGEGPRGKIFFTSSVPRFRFGDRSHNAQAIYMPGGPPNDQRPIWRGPFPPADHSDSEPRAGMPATWVRQNILRAATIVSVEKNNVSAKIEYYPRIVTFKRRQNGTFQTRRRIDRLVIGVRASNLKQFKIWWSDRDLQVGPIVD